MLGLRPPQHSIDTGASFIKGLSLKRGQAKTGCWERVKLEMAQLKGEQDSEEAARLGEPAQALSAGPSQAASINPLLLYVLRSLNYHYF